MNKKTFINELKNSLKELSKEDIEDAAKPSSYQILKSLKNEIQKLLKEGRKRSAIVSRINEKAGLNISVGTFNTYWPQILKGQENTSKNNNPNESKATSTNKVAKRLEAKNKQHKKDLETTKKNVLGSKDIEIKDGQNKSNSIQAALREISEKHSKKNESLEKENNNDDERQSVNFKDEDL